MTLVEKLVKLKNITLCEGIQVHNVKSQMSSLICRSQLQILPCVSLT